MFAPTDEAFAKVLTYHVVSGKVRTVQGQELTLGTTGGVIHVIDTVVMPR